MGQGLLLEPGNELCVLRPPEDPDFLGKLQMDVAGDAQSTTLEQERAVLGE